MNKYPFLLETPAPDLSEDDDTEVDEDDEDEDDEDEDDEDEDDGLSTAIVFNP